jgi:hypothetical protein
MAISGAERMRRYRARLRGEDIPREHGGTPKGYKQAADHVAKRKRFGAEHHGWVGEAVSEKGGRTRAQRLYRDIGPCWACGSEKSERHHIDGDTSNNAVANIAIVCRRCHMEADGRLDEFRELARRNHASTVAAAKRAALLRRR